MAAQRRNVTAQSAALGEAENDQQQVPWKDLSPDILERIYSLLSRKDQVNMSVVCRRWSVGYGMPSVWKDFDFYLGESQLATSHSVYLKFADKYSKMFRRVRIYCQKFSNLTLWRRRFISFLYRLIENSQLESVEFYGLASCWNGVDKTQVYNFIVEFLESQRDLKMVNFSFCCFSYDEGSRILKILAEVNGQNLKRLVIRRFFADETSREQILNALQEYPRILAFANLTFLLTDYSLFFDYLWACNSNEIKKYVKCKTHILPEVILNYAACIDKHMPKSRLLTSDHGKELTTTCPDLQVEKLIIEDDMIQNIAFLIMPNMKIANLVYNYYRRGNEIDIEEFFQHLLACKTNEYLEKLTFHCHCQVIKNFNSFISFVQGCTKLKRIELGIVDPIYAINLMESLSENQSETLKNVHIIDTHLKRTPGYSDMQRTYSKISPDLKFSLELVDFSKSLT